MTLLNKQTGGQIMAITYKTCQTANSQTHNDRNHCTVLAMAISCNMPFIKAHALMAEAGRKKGKGLYQWQWMPVYAKAGYELKLTPTDAKTVTSLPKHVDPNKRYIALVKGHVLAVVNGKVEDWSEGRRHRVIGLYEVIPFKSKNAQRKAARYGK